MNLDTLGEVWGHKLDSVKEYGSLRIYTNVVVWLMVTVVILSVISIMQSATVSFGTYFTTMLFVVAICFVIHGLSRRSTSYRVYKFYRRFRKCDVQHIILCLSEEDIYDAMYTTFKWRLTEHDSIEHYIDIAYESCVRDANYSRKLLKNLRRVERTDGKGKFFDVYFVEKGRRNGLVKISPQILENTVSTNDAEVCQTMTDN